jgi:hypothetical protein
VSSIAHRGFVHLPMDVSKNSIAVAVLPPDRDVAEVDKIFHDTDSVRRSPHPAHRSAEFNRGLVQSWDGRAWMVETTPTF